MTKDEQARARLVEIALETAQFFSRAAPHDLDVYRNMVRHRAGLRDPSSGHWCAAGLTAAMEDAGLVVPEPGTPARRGAIALLDWMIAHGDGERGQFAASYASPGDIIAWKQNPAPDHWLYVDGLRHAFATPASVQQSMCGKVARKPRRPQAGDRCGSCAWETRKGHVAVIVAVDDASITTVGWNEGPRPGAVMLRRLWQDPNRVCPGCHGRQYPPGVTPHAPPTPKCRVCRGLGRVRPVDTVLCRRHGGPYGIARPVAR